ncbi:peptidoglycan-binding protein [Hydrocarboniclastica marina]|uniref:Peptidoglycan-binding protein n=1 Tax=Hydrocarboniclastica marina TaxID=2259620 RepID=A0A4P7XDN4_9ALTE|nr:peptidoglycan-binding protein [Hydrocarboniclastica marina]
MHHVARLTRRLWVFIALLSFSVSGLASDDSREEVRRRVEAMASGFAVDAGSRRLLAVNALRAFYQDRGFKLAWFADNRLTPEALELLQTIDNTGTEGLHPRDYHQQALSQMMQALTLSAPAAAKADLDLLLSDAFLMLGSHLLAGKVDPRTLQAQWQADRHGLEMAPLLAQAVETGSVAALLNTFRPSQAEYQQLRQERQRMLELLDRRDWPLIDTGPLIRPGESDSRLPLIRARLVALGDLAARQTESPAASRPPTYETDLLAAVSRFQARHGLQADGLIGSATIAALNTPLQDRLAQIEVNMERWRWLPERLGDPHIRVNAADQRLDLVSNGQILLSSPARLTTACQNRPVFSDHIHYLVLNPEWSVGPDNPNFALLSALRKRGQLTQLPVELHKGWGMSLSKRDVTAEDWASEPATGSRLVQPPGRENALGEVKFMSAMGSGPLLHGAPSAGVLSTMTETTFGCIQVEAAAELVDGLLKHQQGWTRQKTHAGEDEPPQSETHYMEQPVPLHVQYLTSWADSDGTIHFRSDSLNRDTAVATALKAEP